MEDKVEEIKNRVEKIETWRTETNTRLAIVETDVKTVKEKLNKIESNTTWLLRIVVGAVIIGMLSLILQDPSIL